METRVSEVTARYVPSHIVPSHEDGDESILLVIMTKLSDHHQKELIQSFPKGTLKFKVWTPSKTLLRSIAKQGPHHDSQANLYALAIIAHQSGWSTLLVADELTKCQLTDTCRVRESLILSLVILTVLQKATGLSEENEVRVIAARMDRKDTELELLDRIKNLPKPGLHETKKFFEYALDLKRGVVLHDPDCPVFELDKATTLTRKRWFDAVVEVMRPLPPELVVSIIEHADSEPTPQCLPFEGCTSSEASPRRHVFFLLYETTPAELFRTQSLLQEAADKFISEPYDSCFEDQWIDVEVCPLQSHGIRTRRELVTFWDYYRDPERNYLLPRVHFVPQRIIEIDIDTAQFGIACIKYESPTAVIRTSVNETFARGGFNKLGCLTGFLSYPRDAEGILWKKDLEIMYHPEQPFWYNPLLWISADDDNCSVRSIPLFQLTQQLTEADIETTKEDLISDVEQNEPQDCKKVVCLVPWRRTTDATIEDIWPMFWEFWKTQGMFTSGPSTWECLGSQGMHTYCRPMFCVDRQSAEDRTVLIVMPDWYFYERNLAVHKDRFYTVQPALEGVPCPWVRGLFYFRLPASKARSTRKDPLKWRRMDPEDVTPEFVGRFRRPDGPGTGKLLWEDKVFRRSYDEWSCALYS